MTRTMIVPGRNVKSSLLVRAAQDINRDKALVNYLNLLSE